MTMRQISLTDLRISPAVSGPTVRVIPVSDSQYCGSFAALTTDDQHILAQHGFPGGRFTAAQMFAVLIQGITLMVLDPDEITHS